MLKMTGDVRRPVGITLVSISTVSSFTLISVYF